MIMKIRFCESILLATGHSHGSCLAGIIRISKKRQNPLEADERKNFHTAIFVFLTRSGLDGYMPPDTLFQHVLFSGKSEFSKQC